MRRLACLLVPLLVGAGLVGSAEGVTEVVRAPVSALAPVLAPAPGPAPAVALPAPVRPVRSHRPVSLRIPSLSVSSTVMDLGLTPSGVLEVPPAGFPAGWYTGSPAPGDPGPAVLAGHVDWAGKPGVFADLHRLAPGDRVFVVRADGGTSVFVVTRVERDTKAAFPTAEVYGDLDHPGLRLITCGGAFDRTAHSYEDNVIVFADLATYSPPPRVGTATSR